MSTHITPSAARIASVEALATELAGITADGRYIDAYGQPGPAAPTERCEQSLATIAARKAAVAKRARLVPLLMAAMAVPKPREKRCRACVYIERHYEAGPYTHSCDKPKCAVCGNVIAIATPEDDLPKGTYVHATGDKSLDCDLDGNHGGDECVPEPPTT